MLNVWLWLYYASLWSRDWVLVAMHDPDFWSYRIVQVRLLWLDWIYEEGNVQILISWVNCPKFVITHPRYWAGFWPQSGINYAYPEKPRPAPSQIPF